MSDVAWRCERNHTVELLPRIEQLLDEAGVEKTNLSAVFVSIGPGAVLTGSIQIGRGAVIGAGAVILPELEIGANVMVGAGSVVTQSVPAHCLVLGNPARVVRSDLAMLGETPALLER